MWKLLGLTLSLLAASQLFGSVSADCSVEALANCTAKQWMMPMTPINAAELDNQCSMQLKTFSWCVNSLMCMKNDSAYLALVGQLNASAYLCSSMKIKQIFLRNQQCIGDSLMRSSDVCNMTMSASITPTDMCTLKNTMLSCVLNYTATTCNCTETAHFVARYIALKDQARLTMANNNCSFELPCNMKAYWMCATLQPALSASPTNPWGAREFNSFCNQTEVFWNCVNNIGCTAADEMYTNYTKAVGAVEGNRYMCLPNVTNVFIQNQTCALQLMSILPVCQRSSFPVDQTNSSMDDMCRYNVNMYKCVYLAMKNACNEEVARMIADFNVKQYAYPLLVGINCTLGRVYEQCAQPSVNACLTIRPMMPSNDSVRWNTMDMDNFCGRSYEFATCVNRTSCLKNDSLYKPLQEYVSHRNGLEYLCSSSVRQVYLSNQRCFIVNLHESRAMCYNSSYSDINNSTSNTDICRGYNNMFKCIYNSTRVTCTEQTSRVMTQLAVETSEQYLNTMNGCSFDVASYWVPDVSGAVSHTPTHELLLAFLTISVSWLLILH